MIQLPKILLPPQKKLRGLPDTMKWLSGEGAGSWFLIEEYNSENSYKVSRFSPDGTIECEGQFTTNRPFEISKEYSITYPSHCAKVTLSQFGKTITLHKK